jgi:iron(III) transport system ATP-binding protein
MLKVNGVKKHFEDQSILRGLSLELAASEFGVLLGKSGSGKTTLLRLISGLDSNYEGQIFIDENLMSPQIHPSKRGLSFLFQQGALFPHMTVIQNVSLAIRSNDTSYVADLLKLCELEGLESRFPNELSGGQQQRLALARALAMKPKLILMDEPFSSLDPELRLRLGIDVKQILKQQNVSALMVTHNIDEALNLGDRVGLLNDGALEQWTTPMEFYLEPKTQAAADYTDFSSYLNVKSNDGITITFRDIEVGNFELKTEIDGTSQILLRPDEIVLDPNSSFSGKILRLLFLGSRKLAEVEIGPETRLFVQVPIDSYLEPGAVVGLTLRPRKLVSPT